VTRSPEQRRLYLLRHAKSSWDDPQLADHDRPLAPRGRRASKAMAEHLQSEQIAPEVVLCSTARRAQETLERINLTDAEILIEPELYGASATDLLERLRNLPDTTSSAMLIGHNPAMQDLAGIEGKYPTGALVTFSFEGPWSALEPAEAELVSFVTPKSLKTEGPG
jgi:phosphohistidine phosphatase